MPIEVVKLVLAFCPADTRMHFNSNDRIWEEGGLKAILNPSRLKYCYNTKAYITHLASPTKKKSGQFT